MTTQKGRRSKLVECSVSEPIDLESLRWLVEQCKGFSGNSTVMIKEHKSHGPIEWDEEKITVRGEVAES